jgi:hypothetical protein
MQKSRCPSCNRLIAVKDGVLAKHRTGRSPHHAVAVKQGAYKGTHRTIRKANPAKVKPVCKMSGKAL